MYLYDFVGGKENSVAIGSGLAVGLTAVGVTTTVAIVVVVCYKRQKKRPLPPTPAVAGTLSPILLLHIVIAIYLLNRTACRQYCGCRAIL